MTDLEQSLTGPRAVRDRRGGDPGRDHAGLEDGAGLAVRRMGGEQGPRAMRLPRLRGRALHLRPRAHTLVANLARSSPSSTGSAGAT